MGGISRIFDGGTYGDALHAHDRLNIVSDTTDDAQEFAGRIIDRLALRRDMRSLKIVVPISGNTASTAGDKKKVTVTTRLEDAAATSGAWATVGSTGVTTTFQDLTASATSTSFQGAHEQDVNINGAKRYIRVVITPDVTASSSNVSDINLMAAVVMMNPSEWPFTTS